MSRSIHTGRTHIKELARWKYADPEIRRAEVQELWADIRRKRRAKRQVKSQRTSDNLYVASAEVEAVPIAVHDAGKFVHFPASPDDIRNVMRLLPGGSLDGLVGFELCLGAEKQTDPSIYDPEDNRKPDPLVGRICEELLPGVYTGHCLGYYSRVHSAIRVFAYVYDPQETDVHLWKVYLKLHMLATVVHEVAHSVDLTTRVAKDRWLGDDTSKVEMYAEKIEFSWLVDCVVPYLEKTYPDEVEALLNWIECYGGIKIGLDTLVGDPRRTAANGLSRLIFDASEAFTQLACALKEGKSIRESRLDFAQYLNFGEMQSEALQIVDKLLSEYPNDAEVLTLKANILHNMENYEQSRLAAQEAIAADGNCEDAWIFLYYAETELGNWKDVITVTSHMLDQFQLSGLSQLRRANIIAGRAYARLNLDDLQRMKCDLELALETCDKPPVRWRVATVRALHEGRKDMDGTRKMRGTTNNDERPIADLIEVALASLPDRENEYWDAVTALWIRGDKDAFGQAKTLCSSGKPHERQLGVDILGQLGVPERKFAGESVRILMGMLRREGISRKEQDPNVLYSIGIALGHLGDPTSVKALSGLSEHPSAAVRYGAAFGLCGHTNKLAVKTLIELSSDPYAFVRNWATFGLAQQIEIDTPSIREALFQRIDDEDDDTRAEAFIGLAMRKDEVPELFVQAAEKMADPSLHPVLLSLRQSWCGCAEAMESAIAACEPVGGDIADE